MAVVVCYKQALLLEASGLLRFDLRSQLLHGKSNQAGFGHWSPCKGEETAACSEYCKSSMGKRVSFRRNVY